VFRVRRVARARAHTRERARGRWPTRVVGWSGGRACVLAGWLGGRAGWGRARSGVCGRAAQVRRRDVRRGDARRVRARRPARLDAARPPAAAVRVPRQQGERRGAPGCSPPVLLYTRAPERTHTHTKTRVEEGGDLSPRRSRSMCRFGDLDSFSFRSIAIQIVVLARWMLDVGSVRPINYPRRRGVIIRFVSIVPSPSRGW
jgi:hypothetical protein